MREDKIASDDKLVFTKDNPDNISKVLSRYKNILIRGVWGVGKITNSVKALKDNSNLYYLGNPVDFEGKQRPGSYEKYLKYISSLKKNMIIVEDIQSLFNIENEIVLIIDEIYGRSDAQLEQIKKLLDKENIQVVQIVGCLKNMKNLIAKMDIVLDLHQDGAIAVDKELANAICRIFDSCGRLRDKE